MSADPLYCLRDATPHQQERLRAIDFLILGAQKSGTSWLSTIVSAHPLAFIPERKELHFFNHRENYAKGVDWYLDAFDGGWDAPIIGEATPDYLWNVPSDLEREAHSDRFFWEDQPHRVKALLPHVKLVACLRNPVDRAISAFHHQVLRGRIAPWTRIRDSEFIDDWGFVSKGRYSKQLKVWLEAFPDDRLMTLVYEDDIRPDEAKLKTANRVFEFLGLNKVDAYDTLYQVHNAKPKPLTSYLRQIPGMRMTEYAKGRRQPIAELIIRAANKLAPDALQKRLHLKVDEADREALQARLECETDRLEQLLEREIPWK